MRRGRGIHHYYDGIDSVSSIRAQYQAANVHRRSAPRAFYIRMAIIGSEYLMNAPPIARRLFGSK